MKTETVEFEGFKTDFAVDSDVCEHHKVPKLAHPTDISTSLCPICDQLAIRTLVAKKGEAVKKLEETKPAKPEPPVAAKPEHPVAEPPKPAEPVVEPFGADLSGIRRKR